MAETDVVGMPTDMACFFIYLGSVFASKLKLILNHLTCPITRVIHRRCGTNLSDVGEQTSHVIVSRCRKALTISVPRYVEAALYGNCVL